MATANVKLVLHCGLEKVWNTVTSLENFTWRSDLAQIEVLEDGKQFVEYTKDGYATVFTVTAFEPMKRYEFDMENDMMHGHWVGLFSYDNEETSINFTEVATVKKMILKPFVGAYLKKQQSAYIADLRRFLLQSSF
ncbi:MAG: SRPBCC family protein [Anaerotignum sp.]|nr:SRPBCC family protein [Anaerotignum sp.]